MIPEIGRFALILALMIALAQTILPLIGAARRDARAMAFGDVGAIAQLFFVGVAFGCLMISFAVSDFSVEVVATNSHTSQPLIYRLAGTWGNHEGSMLLWVLILAVFGATVALLGRTIPSTMRARVLATQGLIGVGFLAFLIFTSNPFARLDPAPLQGNGLNPLLQDPGLASHPPMLYLGYVGFSTAFSFAVAALLEGRADAAWARHARPWILAAWVFLTTGIALGSLWAYYELGWGGWWFWDPVENASLMPWLLGTALLHSALVMERRESFVRWTLLLSILTFSLSLIGTFVVRSGVLTSVHAFAVDPQRGVFILLLLGVATGGGLLLYALRANNLRSGAPFSIVSREGSLILNNALIVTAMATVFIGTFYPLLIELLGSDRISVGAPFYALTFVPLVAPVLAGMAVGPMLKWRSDTLANGLRKLGWAAIAGALAGLISLVLTGARTPVAAVGIALAVWIMAASVSIVAKRIRIGKAPWLESTRLALALPRTVYGVVFAHLGVGLLLAGLVAANAWKQELTSSLQPGESLRFAGYDVQMLSVTTGTGSNYEAERSVLSFSHGEDIAFLLTPERRFYPDREMQTTEASVRSNLVANTYAALGERGDDGKWTVRLYRHPLAIWIWLGAAIMALGGALSWSGGLRSATTASAKSAVMAAATSP
ncbi:MAG: heme lyase CcmF/NrfE family subunit [Proteobacteria bacterium]|nr:heme lyase CcmF/NrfE family subunit [Pseudomonadota bacterium]